MKILLVGSTGTIGSQVLAQLKGKHEVITAGKRGRFPFLRGKG